MLVIYICAFIFGFMIFKSVNSDTFHTLRMDNIQQAEIESNPPFENEDWPPNVLLLGPNDYNIESRISAAISDLQSPNGHFSNKRIVIMLKPGEYTCEINVGYYVQVLGLGNHPSDVRFIAGKGVYCPAADQDTDGAGSLDTFWRGVENLHTGFDPKFGMKWAVSQAAPLRRVIVENQLYLHDDGKYASGGFMANVQVKGVTNLGSQQQWISRNAEFSSQPLFGAWSMTYVGCSNAPPTTLKNSTLHDNLCDPPLHNNNIPLTPVVAEKPFITIAPDGKFSLHIPAIRVNSHGVHFIGGSSPHPLPAAMQTAGPIPGKTLFHEQQQQVEEIQEDQIIGFEFVYAARDVDTAGVLQAKLDQGLHLLLTPGIYTLNHSLVPKFHSQASGKCFI